MRKKQFLVSKAVPDKDFTGFNVDGQEMKFSQSGSSFYVSDPGIAHELREKYGRAKGGSRQIAVTEVPMANKDGVHNYTFSIKKPRLEKEEDSKYVWVSDGKGKQIMVKKDDLPSV